VNGRRENGGGREPASAPRAGAPATAARAGAAAAVPLDFAGGPGANVLVRGARLLDPRADVNRTADLLIRDGVVAELGESLDAPAGAEVVDAAGLHAFPAFVDPHVHLRTPGREDEEDIDSGTRAAAAGGFGAILAMPNTDPVVDSAPVLRSLRGRARAEARVPTGFLAAITVGQRGEQLTEMAELADAGAAGFTDDGLPLRSAGVMRQALQYQRLAGRNLALHEEDPSLSGSGVMHEGEVSALLGLAGIPSVSESTMVARDCALAGYEDGSIHVQHVSARETVAAIERAKAAGVRVTCEATPHHLLLTDEAVRGLDTNFKMNPPLRSEADRLALIEGLRSGVIDCIATDHAPHAREEKEQPFEPAPMGVTGLETAFAALYGGLVREGVLGLELLVERMTAGGAPFGLRVPSLALGSPADVCLVDLDAEWEAGEPGYESRSSNCAFDGRRLTGRVRMTIAGGTVAYRERSFALGAV
jgi:dihydroorotase